MSVAAVLLAHNEADTIQDEIRAFHEAIVARIPGAELVVAEDGSRDGTRDRILEMAREVPLRVTGGAERLGYARAVMGAVASTTTPWVFLCDGGLKHDPQDFWRLWAVRERYDYVAGRRTGRTGRRATGGRTGGSARTSPAPDDAHALGLDAQPRVAAAAAALVHRVCEDVRDVAPRGRLR